LGVGVYAFNYPGLLQLWGILWRITTSKWNWNVVIFRRNLISTTIYLRPVRDGLFFNTMLQLELLVVGVI
jgi:hypothetical protein